MRVISATSLQVRSQYQERSAIGSGPARGIRPLRRGRLREQRRFVIYHIVVTDFVCRALPACELAARARGCCLLARSVMRTRGFWSCLLM